ncbi:hypothetical protein QBC47DRAFT_411172 [Echria macrotheca]|uniref:Autophagy-related protein 29 n=1 Tax=Echria macrotheca TaxID=438768 RepID=A0AAJ0BJV3_9PEZI|nr:hypothetical protein QBC47DRAFT_411172 [Echria macrotheca]
MASAKEREKNMDDDVNYVVYVRLPFNRGDFVDPPPVKWDEEKSEKLWSILSDTSSEINCKSFWNDLAAQFEVTVEFLLQMAAYLTERHTSALKAQMRKAATARGGGGAGSNAPSPVPGAEPAEFPALPLPLAAEALRRTGSAAGRAPSSLSVRKDSPLPRNNNNNDPTSAGPVPAAKTTLPMRPQVSRNSSAGTAVPTHAQLANKPAAAATPPPRRRLPSLGISTQAAAAYAAADESEPQTASPPASSISSDSSSSSSSESPIQSRIIRRPPRFHSKAGAGGGNGDDDDDDDEMEPAFLPLRGSQRESTLTSGGSSGQGQDLGATVRGVGDVRGGGLAARRPARDAAKEQKSVVLSQTSDSSTSSAAMVPRNRGERERGAPPGPLSPRRTAELAGRSPRGKGKGVSREGSDGTPSMGSSFSDLDDASVTQSALEEHLASRMQEGTIGSRMSTIGQAFRSRYLPNKANTPRET